MPSSTTQRRARSALDTQFVNVSVPTAPLLGWARAIREALGMSRPALARRLRLTQQSLAGLERSEADGSIRLDSLRRVADALDCDLRYVLVPRHAGGLEGAVQARARQVARAELAPVRHTMALEAQELDATADERMLADRAEDVADQPRRLWG